MELGYVKGGGQGLLQKDLYKKTIQFLTIQISSAIVITVPTIFDVLEDVRRI